LRADPRSAAALQLEKSANNGALANPVTAQAALARAAMMAQMQTANGPQKGAESVDADDGGDLEKISSTDAASSGGALSSQWGATSTAEFKTNNLAPGAAGAAGAGHSVLVADANQNQNAANMQAIVKQAQYMLKKGGGEAIVQMNPEGLGQVHIKVMLDNGKVNLEMKTQNPQTKSILESGMDDLRTALGVHKFAIDHVKVDVSTNMANSNDHGRGQEGFKPDLNREQARNFFNQFHDDNRGQRDLFYETAAAKAYPQQKAFQPLTAAPVQQSSLRANGAASGRLDLVA
jgi:flagellar hook-length control protein FliK